MKNSLIIMMIIAAIALFTENAKAAEKYVQSAGSSVFTIDKEAGTITRQIRGSLQGTPLQSETLSCKYGYIVTITGESTAMLDLLAALNGAQVNDPAMKRAEWARKDCLQYNMETRF